MINKNSQITDFPEQLSSTKFYNKKYDKSISDYSINLKCDGCGSNEIIESGGCYVCKYCGLIIDLPIFKYNNPYNLEAIQVYPNELKKATKLGNILERRSISRSYDFERMSKLQVISGAYKNFVFQLADTEFRRILTALHLPESLKYDCITIFKNIWRYLKKGTKGRCPEKLAPVILFMVLKVKAINFSLINFMNVINVNKNDFKEILMEASLYYPAYSKRDRKPFILKKLSQICGFFKFDNGFMKLSREILIKFWPYIKNTKDDVIVGVVSTLTIIAQDNDSASISKICNKIGIKMSTINYQVKNHIFSKKNILGFTSLVKSSILIKNLVFETILIRPESTQKSMVRKEANDYDTSNLEIKQEEDKIIILDQKDSKEYHFSVNLRDFRDIVPINFMDRSINLIINSYSFNLFDYIPNLVSNNYSTIVDERNKDYKKFRKNSGKGPPP